MKWQERDQVTVFKSVGVSPPTLKIIYDLIDFLAAQPEAVPEKVIMRSVIGRKQYKVAVLRLLLLDETIIRTGAGKNKSPFLYQLAKSRKETTDPSKVESQSTDREPSSTGANSLRTTQPLCKSIQSAVKAGSTLSKIKEFTVLQCRNKSTPSNLNAKEEITPILEDGFSIRASS